MSERISTRSSAKRQSTASSSQGKAGGDAPLPPVLEQTPSSSRHNSSSNQPKNQNQQQNELNVEESIVEELYSASPAKAPPILEAEQTILVDGSSSTFVISPAFDEEDIRAEMAQKEPPLVARQLQNVAKDPLIYYSIREYVTRKKGTIDNLLQMIREHEPHFNITRRIVEQHIERNMDYFGVIDQQDLLVQMKREKQNVPSSINVVKPETLNETKSAEDEAVERRVMELLENTDLAESQIDDDELTFYNPESGTNENMNGAIIMTNDELQYYQMLPEEAYQVLDDFNFRRIEKYEDFELAFRKVAHADEDFNEVTLLQILQYRRFDNTPPASENPRELTKDEALDFLGALDEDFCYYLDLFTHRHIYGIATVGLLIEAKTGEVLTEQAVRRVINARRKTNPPNATADFNVTTGYLSHDYWPSLLCVPEGAHHVRFYNLTNTRNDGFLRYYRCSKCCTIKVSASRDIKNRRYQMIPPDFQVPKLQIRGDQVVTNWNEVEHYPECEPVPIPLMLAEQLDRRARRQASLGLMAPREAWTEAYFEALRISDAVKQYHPDFQTVAELFPSYDTCRGQYSRSFHKYKRVLSMPPELQRVVHKRKLVPSANSIYEDELMPSDLNNSAASHSSQMSKRNRGIRRGREADELFQMHVPVGYKREMVPGYIPVDEGNGSEFFMVEGDETELEHGYYDDAQVDVDQIEQEEVVVTADPIDEQQQPSTLQTSPKKDTSSSKDQQEHVSVV